MKQVQDHYFKKAKKDGFVARSIYKLEEIDKKHRVLKKNDHVLDLGCAPGSWLQYSAKKVGSQGIVIGLDLSEVTLQLPDHVTVMQADVFEWQPDSDHPQEYDVILSDMAPKTTGIKTVDAQRSFNLCERVLDIALMHLKSQGQLLVKVLQGGQFGQLKQMFQQKFTKVKVCKPQSSRSESTEVFLLAQGKRQ